MGAVEAADALARALRRKENIVWAPTLAAKETEAAALPPEGAEFAPWDGPAALIS